MKVFKRILSILGSIILGVLIIVNLVSLIDQWTGYNCPLFGYRRSAIISESMSYVNESNKDYLTEETQRIQKGDMIVTYNYQSFDDVTYLDVLTYYKQGTLICHRVIDKYELDGKQFIILRGDANNTNDEPVTYDMVRGKVVSVVPGLGGVIQFFKSPYLLIAIFGSIFFICLAMFIATGGKKKKEEEAITDVASSKQPVSATKEQKVVNNTSIEVAKPAASQTTQKPATTVKPQPAPQQKQPITQQNVVKPAAQQQQINPATSNAAVQQKPNSQSAQLRPASNGQAVLRPASQAKLTQGVTNNEKVK